MSASPGCKSRFYPRHPRGWRREPRRVCLQVADRFYPRHPRGWRHCGVVSNQPLRRVSIHATLAGGDWKYPSWSNPRGVCFYPRHPRGWRRQKCTKMYSVFCAKGKKLSVKSKKSKTSASHSHCNKQKMHSLPQNVRWHRCEAPGKSMLAFASHRGRYTSSTSS